MFKANYGNFSVFIDRKDILSEFNCSRTTQSVCLSGQVKLSPGKMPDLPDICPMAGCYLMYISLKTTAVTIHVRVHCNSAEDSTSFISPPLGVKCNFTYSEWNPFVIILCQSIGGYLCRKFVPL